MACRLAVISIEQAGTEMIKQIVKLKPCAGLLVLPALPTQRQRERTTGSWYHLSHGERNDGFYSNDRKATQTGWVK